MKKMILLLACLAFVLVPVQTVQGMGDPIDSPFSPCCPMLYVYSQGEYIFEAEFSLGSEDGTDVIHLYEFVNVPDNVNGVYKLRIVEQTDHSRIDKVALTMDGRLPLISAIHSADGNVLPQLLVSDDWKAEMIGTYNHTIDLEFVALSGETSFVFQIEGYGQPLE